MFEEKYWAYTIAAFYCYIMVGTALLANISFFNDTPAYVGFLLLIAALWRLRQGLPSKSAVWASIIVFAAIVVACLQLVPLPPALWTNFSGRQFVTTTLSNLSQTPGMFPLSLAPRETIADLLYALPACSLFFASLSLKPNDRKPVFITVAILALVSAILGLAQKAGGPGNFLLLDSSGLSLGFFANHNFHGAFLFCSIPFASAIALSSVGRRSLHPIALAGFALCFLLLVLMGLGASGSRAATILAMVSVIASAFLVWRKKNLRDDRQKISLSLIGLIVVLIMVAQFGLVGLAKFVGRDPLSDFRHTMATVSLQALRDFFPYGSGFGSFVPLYAIYEQPDVMISSYVNHAHDDWIELVLEGGLPFALVMLGFLVWFSAATVRAWRDRSADFSSTSLRATTIVISLLLVHSIADYPLRTRAMMALFAISCGILAFGSETKAPKPARQPRTPVPDRPRPSGPMQSKGERPQGPFFVKRDPNPNDIEGQ